MKQLNNTGWQPTPEEYIAHNHDRQSRYDIDRQLLQMGLDASDIDMAWQKRGCEATRTPKRVLLGKFYCGAVLGLLVFLVLFSVFHLFGIYFMPLAESRASANGRQYILTKIDNSNNDYDSFRIEMFFSVLKCDANGIICQNVWSSSVNCENLPGCQSASGYDETQSTKYRLSIGDGLAEQLSNTSSKVIRTSDPETPFVTITNVP